MAMKKPSILCLITLLAIAPVCFGQGKPAKAGRSAANESTITDLEKSAWEAYKNKQADAFKALMSKDYYGVYAEGVKNLDAEVTDMAKSDLREYLIRGRKGGLPASESGCPNLQVNSAGECRRQRHFRHVQLRKRLDSTRRKMGRRLSY